MRLVDDNERWRNVNVAVHERLHAGHLDPFVRSVAPMLRHDDAVGDAELVEACRRLRYELRTVSQKPHAPAAFDGSPDDFGGDAGFPRTGRGDDQHAVMNAQGVTGLGDSLGLVGAQGLNHSNPSP